MTLNCILKNDYINKLYVIRKFGAKKTVHQITLSSKMLEFLMKSSLQQEKVASASENKMWALPVVGKKTAKERACHKSPGWQRSGGPGQVHSSDLSVLRTGRR